MIKKKEKKNIFIVPAGFVWMNGAMRVKSSVETAGWSRKESEEEKENLLKSSVPKYSDELWLGGAGGGGSGLISGRTSHRGTPSLREPE